MEQFPGRKAGRMSEPVKKYGSLLFRSCRNWYAEWEFMPLLGISLLCCAAGCIASVAAVVAGPGLRGWNWLKATGFGAAWPRVSR